MRVYEAADVMNLGQWQLVHEIKNDLQCSCLSWNPSINKYERIATLTDDKT